MRFKVVVPEPVVGQVIGQGSGHAASEMIATNIVARRIKEQEAAGESGDNALATVYQAGTFDCVGTDDRRLINRLTTLGIPCVVSDYPERGHIQSHAQLLRKRSIPIELL